jgi:hypothetical protein
MTFTQATRNSSFFCVEIDEHYMLRWGNFGDIGKVSGKILIYLEHNDFQMSVRQLIEDVS